MATRPLLMSEGRPLLSSSVPVVGQNDCCMPPSLPSLRVKLETFASYTLMDASTRAPTTLGELWAAGPIVLVFLRRLGCMLCRTRAAEVDEARAAIESQGARVFAISFEFLGEGSDRDGSWTRSGCWGGTLLTDPTKQAYTALFLRRSILSALYPQTRAAYLAAARFRATSNVRGDGLMLGGTFVVDAGGAVLLDHRSAFFGDDAPVGGILKALARTATARRRGLAAPPVPLTKLRPAPREEDCELPACVTMMQD
jgi:hypothetical protein